jgi:hypothetical protein
MGGQKGPTCRGRRTGSVSGVEDQHLVQGPAPLRDELACGLGRVAGCRAPSPPGDQDGVVQYDEANHADDLVCRGIQFPDGVRFGDDMPACGGGGKLGRAGYLRVERLHLGGIEDAEIHDGRASGAPAFWERLSLGTGGRGD